MSLPSHLLLLFAGLSAVGVSSDTCVSINGPNVRASTLSRFAQAPDLDSTDRIVAKTPDPGTRRWISSAEMVHWGLRPNDGMPKEGICLQRRLEHIDQETVSDAVRTALAARFGSATLILVTSFQPEIGPVGHIRLPTSGYRMLSATGDSCSFLWRGALEYDSHRYVPFEVLGRLRMSSSVLVARRDLSAGDSLSASDYERVNKPGCLEETEITQEHWDGWVVKHSIHRGDTLHPSMLQAPLAVMHGETVRVEALAGAAIVSIDLEATANGRRGESIFARNMKSGKRVKVLLTGPGQGLALQGGQ